MAQVDRGFDVRRSAGSLAGRAALAAGMAFAGFVAPASAQTIEKGRGQCDFAPVNSLVVGDAELRSGTKLYPYPQSGEMANMTWINEGVEVCFPFGGKIRLNADRAYADQKMRENLVDGGQDNRGANGTYAWHYPGNLPAGEEVRHTGTGAKAGEVCPEVVLDKIMAANIGLQTFHQNASFDGDGEVIVNGNVVYTPDSNRRTGQQVRVHGVSDGVQVNMQFGGDYECVQDPTGLDRRADNKVEQSKSKAGFETVNVVSVYPGGRVEITQR